MDKRKTKPMQLDLIINTNDEEKNNEKIELSV